MSTVYTNIEVGPFKYAKETGLVALSRYVHDGSVAVMVVSKSGEMLMKASVIPTGVKQVPEGHVYLKTWSENEGVASAFIDRGLLYETDRFAPCGHEIAGLYGFAGELAKAVEDMPSYTDFMNEMKETEL